MGVVWWVCHAVRCSCTCFTFIIMEEEQTTESEQVALEKERVALEKELEGIREEYERGK